MKKEDIERVCREKNGTVLDFPDRGPWGNNKWRGNCSGWVINQWRKTHRLACGSSQLQEEEPDPMSLTYSHD